MNTRGIQKHIKLSSQQHENIHSSVLNTPFGRFSDSVLDQCHLSFSLMYNRIFKKYWHTSIDARMPRNYLISNREAGIYEVYFPTQASLERNMQYYRIIVKVVPELDREKEKAASRTLTIKQISPNGAIDSELICLIAPKRSEKARRERQFLRGYNHTRSKLKGYLTAIVINPIPEICMKRLLMIVAKFLETRLKKLLEKLKLQPWQYDYKELKNIYYSKLTYKIESFSYYIAQTLRTFSHSLSWILDRLKRTMRRLGRQSALKSVINKFFMLKHALQDVHYDNYGLIAELETDLIQKVKGCYWLKQPLSFEEWKKYVPKVVLEISPREQASMFQRVMKKGDFHG